MKAIFLLGSGISIPAKLPSVGNITDAILSGEGLVINSNWRVMRDEDLAKGFVEEARESVLEEGRERVRRILIFLGWLKDQAVLRYAEIVGRYVNYEDLAYLSGQISDDLIDEYENPALRPIIRNAATELGSLFSSPTPAVIKEELRSLAQRSIDYIRQVVALQLETSPSDLEYLQIFADACNDPHVSEVNIFTLNHDTLLERFLEGRGIKVIDGLRKAGDGSRRWDASVFDNPNGENRVNLFKLHGSVNWWRWDPIRRSSEHEVLTENADRNGRFLGTGRLLYERLSENEGPRILAGTFNKILGYNSDLFLELHYRFHRTLQDCGTLVVCGYGFGDKGINTRIAEWRHRPSLPKLLIIDPANPSAIVQKARGAMQREIAALDPQTALGPLAPGVVMHWQNGLEDTLESTGDRVITWERIRSVIANP